MKFRVVGTVCAASVFFSASSLAALIDGSISLSGGLTPVDASLVGTTLVAATGIDFDGTATVDQAAGDFSTSAGSTATMGDFQFDPVLDPNPVSIWSVDGFTFSMDSVVVDFQSFNFLLLSGSGTVSGNGFDATEGTWKFSANTANSNTFSWSSSSATVVPVPAAVWLFGSGIIGMAGVARRRNL